MTALTGVHVHPPAVSRCQEEEPEKEEGADDQEQPEFEERKEHNADGQTSEQNVQSETAVELAGEASERDQAKEVRNRQNLRTRTS